MQTEPHETHEVQDNKEDLVQSIPSEDEQAKIMAQISKEEAVADWTELKKDQDAIFLEDDPQKALEKLLALQDFPFNERLVYVKHLAELIEFIGDEGVNNLESIIQNILKDSDEVKKSLVTQITPLCQIIEKRVDCEDILKTNIVPCLTFLLSYDNLDIKEQAAIEIAKIASKLTEVDRGVLILKKIIVMAHDEQNEENKIVAAQLFGKLACIMGQELCESFVSLEMLSMGEDIRQRVRKEVVLQLAAVGSSVSQKFLVSRHLPFFIQKCEEKTWQIRKACVEVISDEAMLCPISVRENELTKQLLILLKYINENHFKRDPNKWVKGSAYKCLGTFIGTLHESKSINQQLLTEYCRVTSADAKEGLTSESELFEACSYNFPAVLKTFGPSKWPQLQKVFLHFVKFNDPQVRKPLAYSLHEIAAIIGPQQAEKDLIIVLDGILKDKSTTTFINMLKMRKSNMVQYKICGNFCLYLDLRGERVYWMYFLFFRQPFILFRYQIKKDQKKWRIRELIARQIENLTTIFDAEIVFKIIVPITLKLCNDVVAQVRKQAANKVYALIQCFLTTPDEMTEIYKQCVIENVKAFAYSSRFNQRQAFARMCKNLMTLEEHMFENSFMEPMTQLAQDPVRNVRITITSVVSKHIKREGKLIKNPGFLNIVEILKKDETPEIINLMR